MTLYAAFPDGVYTVDGDEVRALDLPDVKCLAAADGELLVGTRDGLHRRSAEGPDRSTDGGSERILDGHVTAVARGADEWWAGTEPSAVYRSVDATEWEQLSDPTTLPSADEWSFPPRPHTHHVRWLEPDSTREGRWYVAIEAGALLRTDDGGATWRDRPEGARRDTHELATHPDAPGRLYCAAGDGYAESRDGGDSWSYPEVGLDERYCWSVAVDPTDPDVRLLSAARSAMQAHRVGDSSVYRRVGDRKWERVEELPHGEGCYRAVVRSGGDGVFYALSNRGVFHSEDAGGSWARVVAGDRLPDGPPAGFAVDD